MTNPYRSGFISLLGRPNVGKSTLLNTLLEQKVAAVSRRAQTTRRRQLGIITLEHAQLVFMDNPGIHKAEHALGEFMNEAAIQTIPDADVLLWMVDASQPPQDQDARIAELLKANSKRGWTLLVLNKVDLVPRAEQADRFAQFEALLPGIETFPISSISNQDRQVLLEKIIAHLPEGPAYYDEEQITDLYIRDIAADLIRESTLIHLKEEIPHTIGVKIEEFTERSAQTAYIAASLLLERENHKAIVIGKGGEMLKKIGSTARKEIEEMSGFKVFLELKVKVVKNWRDDPYILKQLGYFLPKEE